MHSGNCIGSFTFLVYEPFERLVKLKVSLGVMQVNFPVKCSKRRLPDRIRHQNRLVCGEDATKPSRQLHAFSLAARGARAFNRAGSVKAKSQRRCHRAKYSHAAGRRCCTHATLLVGIDL